MDGERAAIGQETVSGVRPAVGDEVSKTAARSGWDDPMPGTPAQEKKPDSVKEPGLNILLAAGGGGVGLGGIDEPLI